MKRTLFATMLLACTISGTLITQDIVEAGKVTDATGKHMYEAEIKGKDLIFDENRVFLKED